MFWFMFIVIPLVLWLFFGANAAKGWLKFLVVLVILLFAGVFTVAFMGTV